jgi:hypothetical protein
MFSILLRHAGGYLGNEIRCSVRFGDKTHTGLALLETNEIVFRGDVRLKIPLKSVRSVSASNGKLYLMWDDGAAIFELGGHADRWAHKILHPRSTAEKLGIKPGLVISAIGMKDADFLEELRKTALRFSASKPSQDCDLIFLAADDMKALARLNVATSCLGDSGALWIIYPKGQQEIKEQHVLDAGRRAELVDVKVVSFSATHTALKFVRPKTKRPSHLSTRRA